MTDEIQDSDIRYYGTRTILVKKKYRSVHIVKIKNTTYQIKANNKDVAIKRACEKWRMGD